MKSKVLHITGPVRTKEIALHIGGNEPPATKPTLSEYKEPFRVPAGVAYDPLPVKGTNICVIPEYSDRRPRRRADLRMIAV
ncbi:hypothetical protein AZH53_05925 [Methanomicrobiaceae archaeon CYW5]|nr:hypothetical protein [Methanovulcanius yangii]